jgi:hypothetical protein
MDRAFLSASRSLTWALTWARPYRAAMSSITVPVLLVQGARDRLVPVTAAREAARRNPSWRYVELPGVGHVPQLQVPDRLSRILLDWLPAIDRDRIPVIPRQSGVAGRRDVPRGREHESVDPRSEAPQRDGEDGPADHDDAGQEEARNREPGREERR